MQTQNYSNYRNELKQIGDRIEAIANQLKSSGQADKVDSLYRLGDEVEHFFDNVSDSDSSHAMDISAGDAQGDVISPTGNESRPVQTQDRGTTYGNTDYGTSDQHKF